MTTKQNVIDAIQAATLEWTDASWTHEYERGGRQVLTEDGEPIYCEQQHDDCEHCACARAGAAAAARYGKEAADLLRAGEIDDALEQLEQACREERQFGDALVWGAVRKLAQDYVQTALDETIVATGFGVDAVGPRSALACEYDGGTYTLADDQVSEEYYSVSEAIDAIRQWPRVE